MSAEHSGTKKWKAKHSKGVDVKVVGFTCRECYIYNISCYRRIYCYC